MSTVLYEGKAKEVLESEDPSRIVIRYKDDATAFNGQKHDQIRDKGVLNNRISSLLLAYLEEHGVRTHFVEKLSEREQLCRRVTIIPLEVIVRNRAAGSMARRLGLAEGTALSTTVLELSYKNDQLGDPLINDYHAVGIGLTTFEQLEEIYAITRKVNELLGALFREAGIELIDFKLEFGVDDSGELLLADEVSPDTCRFWDLKTGEKMDKDRFRQDLGRVIEGYREVLARLER
ncbi:MAG: phosphoribosylaminoimidazolesuccinocarboxamide synthase [Spirochaetes bacterium]|jgi:phosphoribosylaminoimidazole-succinocarboxamide synthase|nr:phosphoribosylaminoimidazolesuccinocarboxamide synthase [Spirochaetota bacterium]